MPIAANKKAIDALPIKSARYDEGIIGRPGLVVRVWPSGKKVFVHRFKVRNLTFKLTLGEYPAITLAAFLSLHQDQRDQLARGDNPATEAQRESHARAQTPTVNTLAQRYLEEHAKPSKRSWREDERILERDVLPKWGKLDARDITFADVDTLLAKLKADKRRGITAHRKALACVRKMFSFAVKKRLLETNPARGIDAGKPPAARTRSLTDAELHTLLAALPALPLNEAIKDALRLQLLTGTRIGESVGATVAEFDMDAAEWLIPGARTKNRMPLRLPLSRPALAIVTLRLPSAQEGILFPGAGTGRPMLAGSVSHALKRHLDAFRDADGNPIAPFTSHDLRRTVETGLARLGVSREIRDRILNHKDASVGGVHYNQHDYLAEKRTALDLWARKLEQIVTGIESTVTPIRRARLRSGQ